MNTHDNTQTDDAWQLLGDEESASLALLARQRLGFETLEERGRDRLDFNDVAVWAVRDALAHAYLSGLKAKAPKR